MSSPLITTMQRRLTEYLAQMELYGECVGRLGQKITDLKIHNEVISSELTTAQETAAQAQALAQEHLGNLEAAQENITSLKGRVQELKTAATAQTAEHQSALENATQQVREAQAELQQAQSENEERNAEHQTTIEGLQAALDENQEALGTANQRADSAESARDIANGDVTKLKAQLQEARAHGGEEGGESPSRVAAGANLRQDESEFERQIKELLDQQQELERRISEELLDI